MHATALQITTFPAGFRRRKPDEASMKSVDISQGFTDA
jgi:hypothetical protein